MAMEECFSLNIYSITIIKGYITHKTKPKIDRVDRSINARIKKAGFKYLASLDEFDFSFQPQVDEKLIRELSTLSFLESETNVLLIGAPGVGKTHLSIALGLEATKQRRRVK